MAIKYINYQFFVEEISRHKKQKTRIRYDNKEYAFWYEKGKYCFQQYLPINQNIQRFDSYSMMLNNVSIQGQQIENLWDVENFEYIFDFKKDWYRNERAYIRIMISTYKNNKFLYDKILMEAQEKAIAIGDEDIKLNKQFFLGIWDLRLFWYSICFMLAIGGLTALPMLMKYAGVTIMQSQINQVVFFPISLIVIHFITSLTMGFFVPLLSDSPNKHKTYFQCNKPIYVIMFITILVIGLWNVWFAFGVLYCDFLSIITGYVIYKAYYNRKLKEAEKIREEYRREHPEENVG